MNDRTILIDPTFYDGYNEYGNMDNKFIDHSSHLNKTDEYHVGDHLYYINKLMTEIHHNYFNAPSIECFWDYIVPKFNIYFHEVNIITRTLDKFENPVGLFGYIQVKHLNIKMFNFQQLYIKFIKNKNVNYYEMNTSGFFVVTYDPDLKIEYKNLSEEPLTHV